jgi:hypothetical protein
VAPRIASTGQLLSCSVNPVAAPHSLLLACNTSGPFKHRLCGSSWRSSVQPNLIGWFLIFDFECTSRPCSWDHGSLLATSVPPRQLLYCSALLRRLVLHPHQLQVLEQQGELIMQLRCLPAQVLPFMAICTEHSNLRLLGWTRLAAVSRCSRPKTRAVHWVYPSGQQRGTPPSWR